MRDVLDRYYTPRWLVEALLEKIDVGNRSVLEPCAGGGGIVLPIADRRPSTLDYSDVSESAAYSGPHWDFPAHDFGDQRWDWVVTNPPYRTDRYTAADFVKKALTIADNVAMLLRITWLEPCADRAIIFDERRPRLVLVCPRASFVSPKIGVGQRKGTTEHVTCCWYVWGPEDAYRGSDLRWVHQRDIARLSGQADLFEGDA